MKWDQCTKCPAIFLRDGIKKHWRTCEKCYRGNNYNPKLDLANRKEKKKILINKSEKNFIPQHTQMNSNVGVCSAGNTNVSNQVNVDGEDYAIEIENNNVNNNNNNNNPPPPQHPLPDRPINKIQMPIEGSDDNGEKGEEEEGKYDFDDVEAFQYATVKIWLFMEWRTYKWDVLPKDFIKYIMRYQYTTNTLSYRTWQGLLKSVPFIVKYIAAYYQQHTLYDTQQFIESFHNFFFSHKQNMARYTFDLNAANSNTYEMTRKVYNTHSTQRPLSGTDIFWSKLCVFLKYTTLVAVTCLAGVYTYQGVKKKLKHFGENIISSTIGDPIINEQEYDGPHTLIHTFPNFSRYLEETIKIFPKGWWLVSALERFKYGHWGTYNWHKSSVSMGFWDRVRKHKMKQYRPEKQGNLFQAYTAYVLNGITPAYDEIIEEMHSPYLPSRILPIPKDIKTNVPYKVLDVNTAFDDINYEGIYPMMYCVNTMVRPAASWDNQAATIIERITIHTNSGFDNVMTMRGDMHKRNLKSIVKDFYISHVDNPEWYNDLSSVQKKNIHEVIKKHEQGIIETTINCQIKNDELINGKIKSVARFICNLSGEDFYYQGKLTSEISHWLSDFWGYHGQNGLKYKTFDNRIYFTCGSTSKTLDTFVNTLLENGQTGQLVMGDDTWLLKNDGPNIYIIENDFSRYDRTHHKELRDIFHEVLYKNGYAELVEQRQRMYKKDLQMKVKGKKIDVKLPNPNYVHGTKDRVDQLMTGEPATCLANSFTNALTSTYIFNEPIKDPTIYKSETIEVFRQCGLICRDMEIHTEISAATFLKGAFLLGSDHKYHWVRLPSFLAKFGKVLKPHNMILTDKKLSANIKAKMLLRAQWLGYGDMSTNWFYRQIGHEILRITAGTNVTPAQLDFWQVEQISCDIPNDVWNDFMFQRYNITEEEMKGFVDILKSIEPIMLPCIYHSRLIPSLVDRDY